MKNLIIAPHIDDEVLGCGGIIDNSFHIVFCGMQEHHILPAKERIIELDNVENYLDYSSTILNIDEVNQYNMVNYIKIFEDIINGHKPDKIFIPYPSYNQDHQQIHKAALVALRPHDKNHFVKKVVVYEETDCLWGCPPYHINYFIPIDINRKLHAYSLHKSQVREHRSPEHILAQAKMRGAQIGVEHAEGYIIKRWVE